MKTKWIWLLLCALCFFASEKPSQACLHAPAVYKGTLGESSQEGIIFYRDGREELILKVNYHFGSASERPSHIAWVVPVPSAPDHYAVTSPEVFEEAFGIYEYLERGRRRNRSRSRSKSFSGGSSTPNLKFLEKVAVGNYKIQPIQARGKAGAKALNQWLDKNGYGQVPSGNLKYFVDNDFTFLAIKISAPKGKSQLDKKGDMRPLRISFATDQIYYPLKFSSHQGVFSVTLYVLTYKAIQKLPQWIKDKGFRGRIHKCPKSVLKFNRKHKEQIVKAARTGRLKLSKEKLKEYKKDLSQARYQEIYKLYREIKKEGRMKPFYKFYFSRIYCPRVNTDKNKLSEWKKDFFFTLDGK